MKVKNEAATIMITNPDVREAGRILSHDALAFLAALHERFNDRRIELLNQRQRRQSQLDQGTSPDFRQDTKGIRAAEWKVAPAPPDLDDRRVEITGPVDRKMMINALNSGARIFMADFEDALSPTWDNVVAGQANLIDFYERKLAFTSDQGKTYKLNEETATIVVRTRGWHLPEKHATIEGKPVSASLFDFGLYVFHCAKRAAEAGTGAYLYLPKLECMEEAALWAEVFDYAEDQLGIHRGSIRCTVLIETITAAFEMDEILHALRHHIVGLNAGRWDYIFSVIKKFRNRPGAILPDRSQVTMTVPFMRAYTQLLVKTCHKRGAHAIGGMAAFIPNRRDPEVTQHALEQVRKDKLREAGDGFDGTWVAHPDLVRVAKDVFDDVLKSNPNQLSRQRDDVKASAEDLLDFKIPSGKITSAGLENNANVGLQYIASWLLGNGAAAIHNLMEDAATAEIARAQVWQWIRHKCSTDDGEPITPERMGKVLHAQLKAVRQAMGDAYDATAFSRAAKLFNEVALSSEFPEFLTLPAYEALE